MPLLKKEQIDEELCRFHEGEMLFPPVNIEELADAFKMEIAIPGIKRENFLVNIDGHVLFVRVLHKRPGHKKGPNFKLRVFNDVCFERRINLPVNADAEFISAEYKGGILQVIMPKTTRPVKNLHMQVVVY